MGHAQIETTPGEQEQIRGDVEVFTDSRLPRGTSEWPHAEGSIHQKAMNVMVEPDCVLQLEPSAAVMAKIPTGFDVVGIKTESIAIEKALYTQPESNLPELDDTRQLQFEINTASVAGAEEHSWALLKSNIPHNDTRHTPPGPGIASVADVCEAHHTENFPNPASEVCQEAGSPVMKPTLVSRVGANSRKTRFEIENTQHNEPLVQTGNGKKSTNSKHLRFKKKKDQQKLSMVELAAAKVLTDSDAVEFNIKPHAIEESPSSQSEANLSVLRNARQSQFETNIMPGAEAPSNSHALDFHGEACKVVPTEATPT
ncbi:hypothetical protein C0993_000196, partial [Termitomyces sp. T159_Od127]